MSEDTMMLVLEELKRISSILVIKELRDMREMSQKDQVELLTSLGFRPIEIATMLGVTANAVSITISRARKNPTKSSKTPKA
ncbi:MAG: hypothetical protein WC880_04650 [Candidatus Paceibacterota bacterium]